MLLPPSAIGLAQFPPAAGLAIIVFRTVMLPKNCAKLPPIAALLFANVLLSITTVAATPALVTRPPPLPFAKLPETVLFWIVIVPPLAKIAPPSLAVAWL